MHKKIKNTQNVIKLASVAILMSMLFIWRNNSVVLAQENTDNRTLVAIPPRVGADQSLVLKPGEISQQVIRLRNTSNNPVTINSMAYDFVIGDDGVTPVKVKDANISNRWSLVDWMVLTPATQVVQPNQTVGISVLINVPEDALPGGHYAMVVHSPDNGSIAVEGKSAAAVSQEVGSLFYVVVDGPINEEAFIRNFEFPKFTEYGPVPFSFTIENMSDIHVTPHASVEITNMFGKKVSTIKLDQKNVFPLTSRNYEGEWDAIWGHGLYTAQVTMAYGKNLNIVMAKTRFWLLPIKLIIAVGILILIITIAILSIRSHIRHRSYAENPGRIKELENELEELKQKSMQKYED